MIMQERIRTWLARQKNKAPERLLKVEACMIDGARVVVVCQLFFLISECKKLNSCRAG
jgi:hypothetical protein